MPNTLLTNQVITYESLDVLENTLNMTNRINREYNDSFRFGGAVLGQTLNIRKPPRFIGRLGQATQVEGIAEQYVPLTLAFQRGVDTQVSSQDLSLRIDDYRDRILKPKIARLANLVDQDVCSLVLGVNNCVGTPGTVPTSTAVVIGSNSAATKLDNLAAPSEDRYVSMNPATQGSIASSTLASFNPTDAIAKSYRKGTLGMLGGFEWAMDQNVYVHTVGALGASTPEVLNGSQSGASIITDGWSSGTLNAGDVVQFEGVYAVNPQSYQSTGQLMDFVVTATTSDAAGTMTIPISPAMVGPGSQLQNVTALPADNADVFVFGVAAASFSTITGKSTPQNLAYQKNFGTLAMVDLPLPGGTDKAYRASSKKAGISIRVIRDYIVTTDQWIERIDVLYGVTVMRQELACRIAA